MEGGKGKGESPTRVPKSHGTRADIPHCRPCYECTNEQNISHPWPPDSVLNSFSPAPSFRPAPLPLPPRQRAIESGLPDRAVKTMCLKYAALERRLGEVDRARAIFVHASQLADPREAGDFWEAWNAFEIAHGNEDTFREMMRIKRSVSASYSQVGRGGRRGGGEGGGKAGG